MKIQGLQRQRVARKQVAAIREKKNADRALLRAVMTLQKYVRRHRAGLIVSRKRLLSLPGIIQKDMREFRMQHSAAVVIQTLHRARAAKARVKALKAKGRGKARSSS